MKRPQAFTLIELLVVMSIISLLISLLLPALSQSRKATVRTICGTNARSVAFAFNTYLSDNKNRFVPNYLIESNSFANEISARYPSSPTLIPTYSPVGNGVLVTGGYLSNADILYCPSNTYTDVGVNPGDNNYDGGPTVTRNNWGTNNFDLYCDYALNTVYMQRKSYDYRTFLSADRVTLTSNASSNGAIAMDSFYGGFPLLADVYSWRISNASYGTKFLPHDMESSSSEGGLNVGYLDGAVKWFAAGELDQDYGLPAVASIGSIFAQNSLTASQHYRFWESVRRK